MSAPKLAPGGRSWNNFGDSSVCLGEARHSIWWGPATSHVAGKHTNLAGVLSSHSERKPCKPRRPSKCGTSEFALPT